MTVHPGLIKRQRSHFVSLDGAGVDAVLGLNGLIWVAPAAPRGDDGAPLPNAPPPPRAAREAAVRAAAAVRALAALHLQVFPASILEAFRLSSDTNTAVKDMLQPPFLKALAEAEAARRRRALAAEAAEGGY